MKKTIEFSKKIIIYIGVVYLFSLITCYVGEIIFNKGLLEIHQYVHTLAMTMGGLYFGKSGIENYNKIKNNPGGNE